MQLRYSINKNTLVIIILILFSVFSFFILKYMFCKNNTFQYLYVSPKVCDSCKETNTYAVYRQLSNSHIQHAAGLILARGGSKGIKKKNLAKLGNVTLLSRSLNVLHRFGRFSSIWVSTDSEDIAKEAEKNGAAVHWRSRESATDTASSLFGVQDFLSQHPEVDIIGLIQCTSPFITSTFLSEAYDMMVRKKYDSVFSVTRKHDLRWILDQGRKDYNKYGKMKPLNFSPYKRPRRQDWYGELVENGMFYFMNIVLVHHGLLQGGNCGFVEIPDNYTIDIHTPDDLKLAETLLHMLQ